MLNKTKIEWCDYTINPVKGLCPMACSYCYARQMYKRFKWNPEIRYEDVFWRGLTGKPGDKYFVGSTMELFGDWVEHWWLKATFEWVLSYPQRTFIFLTKQSQNLAKWSPFPDNCWVGVSATNQRQFDQAIITLPHIKAKNLFISVEPFLSYIYTTSISMKRIDWLIIGQQTPIKQSTIPKVEWVKEIVEAADKASVPIFLKDNMETILHHWEQDRVYANLFRNGDESIRQEFPIFGGA